jgi:hypothetical protein
MGRVVAVAGVLGDVVRPHRPDPVEGGGEDRGLAGHGVVGERLGGRARQRIEHVAFAGGVDDVVEEGSERRARQLARAVDHDLHHGVDVAAGGHRLGDAT